MDIFKLANDIVNNISDEDKTAIENMDMEKMLSHVTQNIFKLMNDTPSENVFNLKTQPKVEQKTRDICFDLNVDLEDFYNGKKKKLYVKRKKIIETDGKQQVVEEKKKLVIPITPGMKDEQQIVFKGDADQIPGYESGDIIITLIENEHPFFQRDSDNLIIVKDINLYENYVLSFDIKHLDNRTLRIHKNEKDSLHLNDSLRKISGEGMPIYNSPGQFGDLFIRFNIIIPIELCPKELSTFREMFHVHSKLKDSFEKEYILEKISEAELEDFEYYTDSETSDSDSCSSLSSLESGSSESNETKYPRKR